MGDAVDERPKLLGVKNGLGDGIFRTGLDFPLESADLLIDVYRTGIHADADRKRSRFSDRVIADVETVVEFIDHIGQADGVNVKDRRRIGVRAHLRRVTGDQEKVV